MLRAAPNKRCGRCSALASAPPLGKKPRRHSGHCEGSGEEPFQVISAVYRRARDRRLRRLRHDRARDVVETIAATCAPERRPLRCNVAATRIIRSRWRRTNRAAIALYRSTTSSGSDSFICVAISNTRVMSSQPAIMHDLPAINSSAFGPASPVISRQCVAANSGPGSMKAQPPS